MRTLAVIATILAIPFGLIGLGLLAGGTTIMLQILGALLVVAFMLCLVVLAIIASAERIIRAGTRTG